MDRVRYAHRLASEILQGPMKSWDPYDLWATRIGVRVRRKYYAGSPVGKMIGAAFQVADLLLPALRHLVGASPKLYASVLSQNVLTSCIIFSETSDEEWLDAARAHWAKLIGMAQQPKVGMLAWGLPFDWQSSREFYEAGTPFITQSAYAVEAGLALYRLTGERDFALAIQAVGRYLRDGIYTEKTTAGGTRTSYGPCDRSFVYNTSAYRFLSLSLLRVAGVLQTNGEDEQALAYVLSGQRPDGSWPYGEGAAYDYVDHYHTAFVLKCLIKYALIGEATHEVLQCLRRGLTFYLERLFDRESGLPIPYARAPRWNPFSLDGYDLAEAIGVLALLRFVPSVGKSDFAPCVALIERRLAKLLRFPFLRESRSFWRRYGWVALYRKYDRWARAPYRLAVTYASLDSTPFYLKRVTGERAGV